MSFIAHFLHVHPVTVAAGTEEPGTEAGTEVATEGMTEEPTEGGTEALTEGGTEAVTEAPTEGGTEPGTEIPTEGGTEPGTEIPTEGTEPGTEIPTEGTEPGTEIPTEGGTEPGTEEPVFLPVYIGAGPLAGGSDDITVGYTGLSYQKWDLLILMVETANQTPGGAISGWIPWTSFDNGGTGGAANSTRISLYYRWANGPGIDSDVAITDGGGGGNNHTVAVITAWRNVKRRGEVASFVDNGLFTATTGTTDNPVLDFPALTTLSPALVVWTLANDHDTAGALVTWTQPGTDWESFAEQFDENHGTSLGNGGGLSFATGEAPTARGPVADSARATLSTSAATMAGIAFGLLPHDEAEPPPDSPIYIGSGATQASTAGVTLSPHSNTVAGDLLLAIVETANQAAGGTPTGWTLMADHSNGVTAGGSLAARIRVFGRIATLTGSDDDCVLVDQGDHVFGNIMTFRNMSVRSPLNAMDNGVITVDSATAVASGTFPSLQVVTPNSIVLWIVAHALDVAGGDVATWTVPGEEWSGFREIRDVSTDSGNGGGLTVLMAISEDAQTVANSATVAFSTNAAFAGIAFAIKPKDPEYVELEDGSGGILLEDDSGLILLE